MIMIDMDKPSLFWNGTNILYIPFPAPFFSFTFFLVYTKKYIFTIVHKVPIGINIFAHILVEHGSIGVMIVLDPIFHWI